MIRSDFGKNRPYRNDITENIEELVCERANKQENWEVRHTQQTKGDTKTIKKWKELTSPFKQQELHGQNMLKPTKIGRFSLVRRNCLIENGCTSMKSNHWIGIAGFDRDNLTESHGVSPRPTRTSTLEIVNWSSAPWKFQLAPSSSWWYQMMPPSYVHPTNYSYNSSKPYLFEWTKPTWLS